MKITDPQTHHLGAMPGDPPRPAVVATAPIETTVTLDGEIERVVDQSLAEDADATPPSMLTCNTPEFYNNDEGIDCETPKE